MCENILGREIEVVIVMKNFFVSILADTGYDDV